MKIPIITSKSITTHIEFATIIGGTLRLTPYVKNSDAHTKNTAQESTETPSVRPLNTAITCGIALRGYNTDTNKTKRSKFVYGWISVFFLSDFFFIETWTGLCGITNGIIPLMVIGGTRLLSQYRQWCHIPWLLEHSSKSRDQHLFQFLRAFGQYSWQESR